MFNKNEKNSRVKRDRKYKLKWMEIQSALESKKIQMKKSNRGKTVKNKNKK